MKEKKDSAYIECFKCGHEWRTKSKLKTVTCPSCRCIVSNPGWVDKRKEVSE